MEDTQQPESIVETIKVEGDESTEGSMLEMQLKVIQHFRNFFTPEGQAHFDIAYRNMEIIRLSAEVKQRDELIASMIAANSNGNGTSDDTGGD